MYTTDYENVTYLQRGEIWEPHVIQRVVTLSIIMAITIIGNVAILVLLCCFSGYCSRYRRVNIFIMHLAVGDLSVCVCTMSTEILFVAFGDWILGKVACKIMTYAQIVTLAGTTFILTSMSFDRYVAICRPLSLGTTTKRAKKMIIASWVSAFIIATPQIFIFKQTNEGMYEDGDIKHVCKTVYPYQWQRKLYFSFMTSYILVIPAILISFCYINVVMVVWKQWQLGGSSTSLQKVTINCRIVNKRSWATAKIRTILMTFSIIITFIACWAPYFVTTLITIYSENKYTIKRSVIVFAETLAVLPSALNPILYGLFNYTLVRSLVEKCCNKSIHIPLKSSKRREPEEILAKVAAPMLQACDNYKNLVDNTAKHSSSFGSNDRPRSGGIITEENVNGIRLRVRFIPKEGSKSSSPSENKDKFGDLV